MRFTSYADILLWLLSSIIPNILAAVTGKARYRPEIDWSGNSWVHNIFRVYELIFWRRVGLRPEIASADFFDGKGNKIAEIFQCFTFEGVCAQTETYIRQLLSFNWFPVKVQLVKMETAGISTLPFGYSFAIAVDVSGHTDGFSGNSNTRAHTCTGSNRVLSDFTSATNGGFTCTTTYNSVAMTRHISITANYSSAAFTLIAPATGANNIVESFSGATSISSSMSISFSGADQTTQPDGSNTASVGGSSAALTMTSTKNNTFFVDILVKNNGESVTVGGSQTQIFNYNVAANKTWAGSYKQLAVAGNYDMAWSMGGGSLYEQISIGIMEFQLIPAKNRTLLGAG